jgi:putative photosynthetic complex assembly protein 2
MPLAMIGAAILYTVFAWWFSTGAILWLDRLPRRTFRWSLAGATLVAGTAAAGLVVSQKDATPGGAILGFTCALGLWGWHEMTFLMGVVTGPRHAPCPPGAKGWRRFRLAAASLIFHELALAVTALTLAALAWGQPNPTGAEIFLVLFAARLSSKLNLFLGVPNFSLEFFPDHLRYLASYLRKGPVTPLFPLSIAGGVVLAFATAAQALAPGASAFVITGGSLIFALTALALLEHAFMVLPLPDTALWRWAMPATATPAEAPTIDV